MFNVRKGYPLYEQIYESIKESIVSGELKPGERMIDSWVAEKLSVSRSPVREAFRKLEQDGLLVNKDGTTLVYEPNVSEVIELFQVRAGLEGIAVFLATKSMSVAEIEELGKSIKKVEIALKEKSFADVVKLNTYFHESIIGKSKNEKLSIIMQKINTLTLLYRNNFFAKYYGNDEFRNEHLEIWQAMKVRNPELASEKMRKHILNDLDRLIERLGESPE